MEYFQLQHSSNEIVLCDYPGCDALANHLDVNEEAQEWRLCELHTHTNADASRLPKRKPNAARPYKSRPTGPA